MAHQLETYNDVASFVYTGETPWHGLGTKIDHLMTVEEALALSRADYQVSQRSVFSVNDKTGAAVQVPNVFTNVRYYGDEMVLLGTVSDRYQILQNRNAFRFCESLVELGASIETMGVLDSGERAFTTLRLNKEILIGGTDRVDLYLVAANGHDGKTAFSVMTTPVRVVCNNTLRMATKNAKSTWRMRHVKSLSGQMSEARRALEISFAYADEFKELAESLQSERFSDAEWETFRNTLVPEPENASFYSASSRSVREKRAELNQLYYEAPTQANCRGTRWGAYNAYTEWVDFKIPVRSERLIRNKQFARSSAALLGESDSLKNKALALLTV
jgi:phage/plasmid-like protein (TIGR03299 family)